MDKATVSLSTRIVELAHERRRFGYRRIHDLLNLEGHQVNHKRVWRLYKLANLSVRKRRKVKQVTGERQPLAASRHINETWSTDFVMDALSNGRRIKCLTVVDDFSRENTEGAKFWLKVFNDLKTRGVADILIAVTDGLKGLPEALGWCSRPPRCKRASCT